MRGKSFITAVVTIAAALVASPSVASTPLPTPRGIIALGGESTGVVVAADGRRGYALTRATSSCRSSLVTFEPTSKQVLSSLCLTQPYLSGLSITPDGSGVFFTAVGEGPAPRRELIKVDTSRNAVAATMELQDADVTAVSTDGSRVYIPGRSGISVIDVTTTRLIKRIALGFEEMAPTTIITNPVQSRAYAAYEGGNPLTGSKRRMVTIDTASDEIVGSTDVRRSVSTMAVSTEGRLLYTADQQSGILAVLDSATLREKDLIRLDSGWRYALAVAPSAPVLYAADSSSDGWLKVVDTASNSVVGEKAVGRNPIAVTFTPDGTRAFVALSYADYLRVLDTGLVRAVSTQQVPSRAALPADITAATRRAIVLAPPNPRTTAGQPLKIRVKCSPKRDAGKPTCLVRQTPRGKVTLAIRGQQKARVTVTQTAPGDGAWAPYRMSKTYTVTAKA